MSEKNRPPKAIESFDWVGGFLVVEWRDYQWVKYEGEEGHWEPYSYRRVYVEAKP